MATGAGVKAGPYFNTKQYSMTREEFFSGKTFTYRNVGHSKYIYCAPMREDGDASVNEISKYHTSHNCNIERVTPIGIHVYTVVVGKVVRAFIRFNEMTITQPGDGTVDVPGK